jgi:hypothetical protein
MAAKQSGRSAGTSNVVSIIPIGERYLVA